MSELETASDLELLTMLDFEPDIPCSYRDCPHQAVVERHCTDCGHYRDVCETHVGIARQRERGGHPCGCTAKPVHYRFVPLRAD